MSFKYFKGSISFEIDGKVYNFEDLEITNEGVPEICKYNDNLSFKINKILNVKIKPTISFDTFTVKGKLFVNNDIITKSFGINFIETTNVFKSYINKNGKSFSKWTRSSPRINSEYFEKSLEKYKIELSLADTQNYTSLHLLNISLGGFGVFGSISETKFLKIDSLTNCKFTTNTNVNFFFMARVVRITTVCEYDNKGNEIYINHIGLKFVNFDEENKKVFLETVKEVINNINK